MKSQSQPSPQSEKDEKYCTCSLVDCYCGVKVGKLAEL